MRRLIVSLAIIVTLASVACPGTSTVPATDPQATDPQAADPQAADPRPTLGIITHVLEVIADPSDAADVLLNPTPIDGGRYVHGRTVIIDVLPKKGWQVDEWAGPVYEEVGVSAKIDMNSSQTVIIRLVPDTSVPAVEVPVETVELSVLVEPLDVGYVEVVGSRRLSNGQAT